MKISFYKYEGAGNDFVILDQREQAFLHPEDQATIMQICDRRFGVGADGLMCIEHSDQSDFTMVYYNADGRISSMCGNGGRCIVALAHKLQIFKGKSCLFDAIDGLHKAIILDDGQVSVEMKDVMDIECRDQDFILDTGSPHFVRFTSDMDGIDMVQKGREIRYSPSFEEKGINVNYVVRKKDRLFIRTYERGVEDETLACGTGVTAAALAAAITDSISGTGTYDITARGGKLTVSFERTENGFKNIWLTGPATYVFEGFYDL